MRSRAPRGWNHLGGLWGIQLVSEPLEETWPLQLPSGPPRLLGSGVQVKQPPCVRPRRPPRRDQVSLSAGPAPGATAPPRGARARTAIMICLVLTIFANLFPAGERSGAGGGWAAGAGPV